MAGALLAGGLPLIVEQFGKLAQGAGYYTMTASGAVTLNDTYPNLVGIDAGGAGRNVTLDDEATHKGLLRVIVNRSDAAEDLTVKDSGGDTIGTVSQNELAVFYCDGTAATGWALVAIIAIALA